MNSISDISDERCRTEFQRLEIPNLETKFEITIKFNNLRPHRIPSHSTIDFEFLPQPFIATNPSLFVSYHPFFRRLHGSITLLNTLTFFKNTVQFYLPHEIPISALFRFPLFLLKYLALLFLFLNSPTNTVEPNDPHHSDSLVSHYVPSNIFSVNLVQFVSNRVLTSFPHSKALVLVLMFAFVLMSNALKHGSANIMLNARN